MTVIAFDGNIAAADRQGNFGDLPVENTKIFQHKDMIVGWAGDRAEGTILLKWFKNGENPDQYPTFKRQPQQNTILVVVRRSNLGYVEFGYYGLEAQFMLIEGHKFFAWGCASEYAMGAMAAGATASQAVEIACKYDNYCGKGVTWFQLPPFVPHMVHT